MLPHKLKQNANSWWEQTGWKEARIIPAARFSEVLSQCAGGGTVASSAARFTPRGEELVQHQIADALAVPAIDDDQPLFAEIAAPLANPRVAHPLRGRHLVRFSREVFGIAHVEDGHYPVFR